MNELGKALNLNMQSTQAKSVFNQITHPMPIRLKDVNLLARTIMDDNPEMSESEAYEYIGNSGIAKFPNVITNKFSGTVFVLIPPDGPQFVQVVMIDFSGHTADFSGQIKIKGLLDEDL